MRYITDLTSSDPQCADGAQPTNGRILVAAELANGSWECWKGTTLSAYDPATGEMKWAKSILHAGTWCNDYYEAWNWATNGDYPGPDQYDFAEVLTHELGHAIGFNHSADPTAVMHADAWTGTFHRRLLAPDDVNGLAFDAAHGYGRTNTQFVSFFSTNEGLSWPQPSAPGDFTISRPSICEYVGSQGFSDNDLKAAYVRASDSAIVTFDTNNHGYNATWVAHADTAYRAPAMGACNQNYSTLVWLDAATMNIYKKQFTHWTQSWGSTVTSSVQSGVTPTIGSFPNAPPLGYTVFVMAYTDRYSGLLRMMTSTDGINFNYTRYFNQIRTFHDMQMSCSATTCYLVYSNGGTAVTKLRLAEFTYDGVDIILQAQQDLQGGGYTTLDSYGAGIAIGPHIQVVWRDRGAATVLTSGYYTGSSTLSNVTFTPIALHSPPQLAWSYYRSEYDAYSTYSSAYNAQ